MRLSMNINRRSALRTMVGSAAAALLPGLVERRALKAWAAGSPAKTSGEVIAREPNGAEIHQVTTDELSHSNIYCEVPYCSADSRYFVFQRGTTERGENRTEFVVVELGTWKQHRLDLAISLTGCAIRSDGMFYYVKRTGGDLALMRADLAGGTPQEVYRRKDGPWIRTLGTVTTDGRYYAGGLAVDDKNEMFGVTLVDLEKGTEAIIDRAADIFNAHPQFDPGAVRRLMIQHNRGGTVGGDGKIARSTGPEGATLYVLSVPDGKRTELKVGKPYTTACTGHEAWAGTSGEMILTVSATGDFAPEKGCLLGVRPSQPHRVVGRGGRFGHIGASRCGRLFSVDDCRDDYNVLIGSIQTGRLAVVCASKTKPTRSQSTHVHPYLTPDFKWAVFNSNRSGSPQIYAARVPEEIVKQVLG